MSRAENGEEMTTLPKDGGPAFGAHAFIWAGEWTREGAERVISGAAEVGVELGVEAINRYETYLVNLASQAGELLDRIDEPNVFVHLDTYHMNIEEKGFHEPIVSLGSRLGYIHLSESDRGTPGTANVHWDEVFRGLKDIDYR